MPNSAFRLSDRVNVYLFFGFKIFITPRDVRVSTVMSIFFFLKFRLLFLPLFLEYKNQL